MSRLAVLLVALTLVTVLVPAHALGQAAGSSELSMAVSTQPRPVKPEDPQQLSIQVDYDWTGYSTEPTQVSLAVVESPPWIDAFFPNETFPVNNTTADPVNAQVGLPQGSHRQIVDLNYTLRPSAPSFEVGLIRVEARAEENMLIPAAQAQGVVNITAGFKGSVDVSLPKGSNVTAWGGLLTKIPIEVENQANGPILVSVNVVRSPADAIFETPPQFQVNATEGDRVSTGMLEVRVPWSVNEEGPVVVEVSPSHVRTGDPLKTTEARFQLNGKSAAPIPSPAPWLVLAGLGLLALARTHTRRYR